MNVDFSILSLHCSRVARAVIVHGLLFGGVGTATAQEAPVTINQENMLLPDQSLSSPENSSSFGIALALDGDRALIGSADKIFIYNVAGTTTLEATLPLTKRAITVAISGKTAVIGHTNSVSVFERNNSGWSLAAELEFVMRCLHSCAVAIDGNYLVVGTRGRSGYVYERIAGVWNQVAELVASDDRPRAGFSSSVAISGDTIVFGATGYTGVAAGTGAAYIFERNGGSWTQQAKLFASDGIALDQFGRAVAINGNNLLIGHSLRPDSINGFQFFSDADTVYAYQRSASGSWDLIEKIATPIPSATNRFGTGLSLFDNKALIGETESGNAYLYSFQNGVWSLESVLDVGTPPPRSVTGLIALSSDHALVGYIRSVTTGNVLNVFRLQLSGACVDSDGDGWGWDGTGACRASNNLGPNIATPTNNCDYSNADQYVGWGWDPVAQTSCAPNEPPVVIVPTNNNGAEQCDYSNANLYNGWGWNSTLGESCAPQATVLTTSSNNCVDDDNDGWGWNGTSSCRVTAVQCIDLDGDGWGWDGTSSCRVD